MGIYPDFQDANVISCWSFTTHLQSTKFALIPQSFGRPQSKVHETSPYNGPSTMDTTRNFLPQLLGHLGLKEREKKLEAPPMGFCRWNMLNHQVKTFVFRNISPQKHVEGQQHLGGSLTMAKNKIHE